MSARSFWEATPLAKKDAIFGLAAEAKKAQEPKANLIVGAYRDENGKPYPLKVVQKAECTLANMCLDKEYLPMSGYTPFIDESLKLAYGDSVPLERVVGVQSLSGTGALSLGFHFLARILPRDTPVYLSDPTWPNHYAVIQAAGFTNIRTYRYYCAATHGLDFDGMLADLCGAPENSIILFHACAHNPTGVDPTQEQWGEFACAVKHRRLIPFFDCAYQGFATGVLENDAYSIRLFAQRDIEMVLAQSFSKNMGLYSERAGVCSVVMADSTKRPMILSQFENIARSFYSNPPAHGARVAHLVMSEPQLRAEWEAELRHMSSRVLSMRSGLYHGLRQRGTPGNWEHVLRQVGMFSYLGLSEEQCENLVRKRVFVLPSGRANMAGLTQATTKLLVDAIDEVVRATAASNKTEKK